MLLSPLDLSGNSNQTSAVTSRSCQVRAACGGMQINKMKYVSECVRLLLLGGVCRVLCVCVCVLCLVGSQRGWAAAREKPNEWGPRVNLRSFDTKLIVRRKLNLWHLPVAKFMCASYTTFPCFSFFNQLKSIRSLQNEFDMRTSRIDEGEALKAGRSGHTFGH